MPIIRLVSVAVAFHAIASVLSAADAAPLVFESPAAGDRWAAGSGHWVAWNAKGIPATEKLALELDSGDGWKGAGDVENSGRFLWTVPATVSDKARLRLTAKSGAVAESPVFSLIPSQAAAYEWKKVTMNAAWAPRDGAGALVYKGRMWMLGGWNPSPATKKFFPRICNNEVWSTANGADWTLEKPNTFLETPFDPASDWEGRHTAGYVVHQDKMWIVGGDCNQKHYQFDVWNSTDGKKWTWVNAGKPIPWGPRSLHYTVAFQDKIWVIGGQTMPQFAPAKQEYYRDVWNSSDGVEWTKVELKEPAWVQRGMIGGGVVFNNRIWLLGGGTYDTPEIPSRNFFNDVWSTADGSQWTKHVDAAPWDPRQYHDVGVFDGRMWILEGYHKTSGNRKDVWYSQDGVNWYEVPNTPWKARHAAGVYTFENGLWMVGGNNMEPDAWKLVRAEGK